MSSTTRIGQIVAGYRLERLLGRGGMSVVYLAEHVRLGRKVALKLLSPALSEDESFRERFERESRRAAEIDHPNIVPIYDAGDAEGQFFIAMRYVRGADLKTSIKNEGRLSVGRTLYILEQAASALDAAHELDLVHRDVKPANILIEEPSDRVFLTDFGVVKHTASHGLTRTGFFIGTVDYAAPEQIEGLPVDARTDVYALGCVLYECLAGRAPFDRDAEVAVMHAHLTEPPPSLRSARPDLPRDLDRVIAAAMAKSKDDRQSSCEELIVAAHAALLGRGTGIAQAPVPVELEAQPEPPESDQPEEEIERADQDEPGVVAPVAVAASTGSTAADAERQPTSGGGRRGSKLPGWLLAAIAAVGAAAVTGIVVYFATGSDNSTPTTTGTLPIGQQKQTVVGPNTKLQDLVEPALFRGCTVDATPRLGASESATCTPPAGLAAGQFYPDRLDLYVFESGGALGGAYDQLRQDLGIGRDFGNCSGRVWGGEGEWLHGPDKPGGRRFCTFEGNVSVIAWMHEKLGQETHKDFLGVARLGGSDHARLFNWWNFWHHRNLGKLPS
ncbi:MAG: serine/threonine-protein kinase [Thermoleophilaceae bacterium]|jgi:serine/threonine-protein kinase